MIKIVGSRKNRAIQFAFDKLQFTTDIKTLKRTINLEKSWVSLISDSEAKVSSDFSLSGTMIGKDLSITIPKFTFNVPFKYIVVLEDFIALFLKYKDIFTSVSLPKIDISLSVEMKGMDANIKKKDSHKSKNLKIRKIKFTYKDSILQFSLSSIKISKSFHLDNLTASFDKQSLDIKLNSIYIKVIKLLSLLPDDAFQILQNKNQPITSTDDNSDQLIIVDSDSDEGSTDANNASLKQIKTCEIQKIKIKFITDKIDIDLSSHKSDPLVISLKEIGAVGDNEKIKAGLTLDQVLFANKSIAQNIELKSEVVFADVLEIYARVDNFNFDINKELIDFFANIQLPKFDIPVPKSFGFNCKFSLKCEQATLSNDFVMKNFSTGVSINDTKIDVSVGIDSISSSFIKFESKDLAQLAIDLAEQSIKLTINLEELTVFVIPLLDVIAMFPKSTPKIPKIDLLINVKPVQIKLFFSENYLNVILNSPLKFKFNTLDFKNPHVSLKMSKLLVNLNNDEIVGIRLIKFKLNKDVTLEIPSINITLSVVKIYTLIKMITCVSESSVVSKSQKKIAIYTIPFESVSTRIPLILIIF